MIRYLSAVLCMFLVCACGSKTTVILLPQEDGTTGSVVVKHKSLSTTLDKPYTYTAVRDGQSDLTVASFEKKKVADDFQHLLEAEPAKPVSFILYFKYDSTKLNKASLNLIPRILKSAKEREPSEISIIGHTDSKGSREYNIKLSLNRAHAVLGILKRHGANLEKLYVESHGENDPLIVTGDNVSEPRNRRVEIMIR